MGHSPNKIPHGSQNLPEIGKGHAIKHTCVTKTNRKEAGDESVVVNYLKLCKAGEPQMGETGKGMSQNVNSSPMRFMEAFFFLQIRDYTVE